MTNVAKSQENLVGVNLGPILLNRLIYCHLKRMESQLTIFLCRCQSTLIHNGRTRGTRVFSDPLLPRPIRGTKLFLKEIAGGVHELSILSGGPVTIASSSSLNESRVSILSNPPTTTSTSIPTSPTTDNRSTYSSEKNHSESVVL